MSSFYVPMTYKMNFVRALFHRARMICSVEFLVQELRALTETLKMNGYPDRFINTCGYADAKREVMIGPS